jgi:hypothetical protein
MKPIWIGEGGYLGNISVDEEATSGPRRLLFRVNLGLQSSGSCRCTSEAVGLSTRDLSRLVRFLLKAHVWMVVLDYRQKLIILNDRGCHFFLHSKQGGPKGRDRAQF